MMRVAFVTPVYPPYRGGIGAVAEHDARCLRALGVEVDVFTPQHKVLSVSEKGITRLQPFFAWGNGAILFGLFQRLRSYDVVHVHYPFFGSDILAVIAARFWRIPLVMTYHMKPKASGLLGLTFRVYRFILEPLMFRSAQALLVSSQDYADAQGIKHPSMIEMPFGIDTERFVPGDRLAARRSFGIDEHISTILFVGGLDRAHYFKGVDVLLRACAAMKAPWQLLIVGDGNCRKQFEALACELRINDRVHFAGSVPFGDLPRAYQAADVHVLPSIDRSEAFGVVTLEAMSTGIPSIVSDLPGVRQVITPNETGSLVLPGDVASLTATLDRYCSDEAYTKACGARARIRACAHFDEKNLAKRLLEVYNNVSRTLIG